MGEIIARNMLNWLELLINCYCCISFVFQFAIQNSKDEDIQNYNLARGPVWVWKLVADIEGGT